MPGSRDDGRQDGGTAPGSAPRIAVALAVGADRDLHAHRDQRRRVHARTADGRGNLAQSGWIYEHGVLVTSAVDSAGQVVGVSEGEWWRLITATFLHYGPLHLGMNMLVLWFIGPPLEEYFGHGRYMLVYLVSGLAGSAGALIFSPNALTVGASGAIWGIMGAALSSRRGGSTSSAGRRWGSSSSTVR